MKIKTKNSGYFQEIPGNEKSHQCKLNPDRNLVTQKHDFNEQREQRRRNSINGRKKFSNFRLQL